MTPEMSPPRRPRVSVDLPGENEAAFRHLASRYFRSTPSDAIRVSVALLLWLVRSREAGKRVIAVPGDALPERFEEPVVPGLEEVLAPEWAWLVSRPHPWRRQLWIKGRRLTAGDLARTMEIEDWSPERAAAEFDLPVDAIVEAQRYAAANRDLVEAEEREDRLAAEAGMPRASGTE